MPVVVVGNTLPTFNYLQKSYYYEVGNPAITDKFLVSGLIALVNEHLQRVGVTSSVAVAETKAHYGQIVDLIKKKKVETETAERFGLIVC